MQAQVRSPVKGDWILGVQQIFIDLEIELELEEIKNLKKETLRNFVKEQIDEKCLLYLNKQKEKHTKVMHIVHSELENDITEKDKTISEQKGVIENTRRDIEEMNNLKTMKTKARQIQESELMKKDRKISILNTILTQERRILLEKEEELEIIRKDPNKVKKDYLLYYPNFV